MEIFIDGKKAVCDSLSGVSITLSVVQLLDEQSGRTGYARSISIPALPQNCAIMGYPEQIHGKEMFHAGRHTARIEHQGAVIIEGTLTLEAVRRRFDTGMTYYDCNIIGASKLWAEKTAERTISSLEDDFRLTLTQTAIQNSWTDAGAWIRMLPVCRKPYSTDFSSGHLTAAAQILTTEDYHPFIHVATLLRKIMAAAGYTLVSQFADSEFFGSLYISGRYPSADTSLLNAAMDFRARKYADVQAQADYLGRVYANPYAASSSVGNIADSADPMFEKDWVRYDDVFSRSGCFASDGKRVVFKPTKEVSVGFRYEISYTTSYRILSRTELAGFNRIYLGENFDRSFRLANRFIDRSREFRAGKEFRIVVFDHRQGDTYRLYCSDGQTSIVVDDNIATRSKIVSIQHDGQLRDPTLYIKNGDTERIYTGDWALYDGYVTETGQTDVNITLNTGPETLSPADPKLFDDIYFGGAEPGMTLTLHKGTSVRPVFSPHPTEGATLSFKDVAAYSTRQIDFIAALRHMFSLCFYTDAATSTVYMEPATTFFESDKVTDWTDKIDFSQQITIEEIGAGNHAVRFCYKSGDAAVADFNRKRQDDFGAWVMSGVENTESEIGTRENPMFAPTITADGVYPDAPDARIVMAKDSSAEEGNLNFTAKIVRYHGMKPLPASQSWGWPSGAASYPLLSFGGCTDDDLSLCFEDRDGKKGLNRFYGRSIDALRRGRRVTLFLFLSAADIEPLIRPSQWTSDFRSRYRLDIEGESGYYILEQVCDFCPERSRPTKCTFIKI